jgi:Uncharacterized protein conserved in bacteria (DUF2147)
LRAALTAILVLAIVTTTAGSDQNTPDGLWQPLDSSGKPLGLIRIYQDHGLYFGQIMPSSPGDSPNERCVRCTDERKNEPIIGLTIIRNMRRDGDVYLGGDVLDPTTGRIYGCRFHLTDGGHRMIMRGFLGIPLLGRSMIWARADSPR